MSESDVEDPLKHFSEIFEPDKRHRNSPVDIKSIHRILDGITLNNQVPNSVRQLFETAKNLSLYSWYVYRFHQVSETVAYSALELALKWK